MASTRNLRRRRKATPPKLSKSALLSSASANDVMITTSVDLPVRRVSDPDMTAAVTPTHQDLVSSCEDTSVASSALSSCDDETLVQQVVNTTVNVTTNRSAPVTVEEDSEDISAVQQQQQQQQQQQEFSKTLETAKDSASAVSNKADDIAQCSIQDLFQKWHYNRVVKRRHPAIRAFPGLKPFDGFHESNTAPGGYTFGPYFDRWYAKQQERAGNDLVNGTSAPTTTKRPHDAIIKSSECTTPRPTKKVKSTTPISPTIATAAPSSSTTATCSIQQQRNLNSLHKWNAANALYRSEIVALEESFQPGPYTVIMGRRLKAPGCVHLRNVTDQYAKEYKQATAMDKSRIVTKILKRIYAKAPIGAFVRCKAGQYFEVEDLIAREKIVSELIAGGLQLY